MKKLIAFMGEKGIKASVAKGIIVGIFVCVVAGILIPIWITLNNRVELVKDSETFELGEKNALIVSDYLKGNIENAKIDTSNVDFTCAGDYIATISVKKDTYDIHVIIQDTIAPTFDLIGDSYNVEINSPVNASDVITSIADASNNLTITIGDSVEGDAPNTLSTYGANNNPSITFDEENDYEIEISVSDPSGNETTKKLLICVYNLPIITNAESTEFVVEDTDGYSNYKANITATDSRGEDITSSIKFDESNFDISNTGDYTLIVTATDKNGFVSTIEIDIVVKEKKSSTTEAAVNGNMNVDKNSNSGNSSSSVNTKDTIGNGYYSDDGTVYYFSELSDLILHEDGRYYPPDGSIMPVFNENNKHGLFKWDGVDVETFNLYKKYVYEEKNSIRVDGDTFTITLYQHASDDVGAPGVILSQYLGLPEGDCAYPSNQNYVCRLYGTEDDNWNGYSTYVGDEFFLYGTQYTFSSFYEAKNSGELEIQKQFYMENQ